MAAPRDDVAASAPPGLQGQEPEVDAGLEAPLDPEALATCQRLAGMIFPWDTNRALELALLKTFCVPSIAGLLDRTGEFEQRTRKRYDDTGLMVAELLRQGPDSDAGRAVIARMNRIHGHYAISNHDFLYVLSTFVAEPIRWLQRYGWRAMTTEEERALFRFWRRVGERMGIEAIPDSLEALLSFNERFEAGQFAAAPAHGRVAEATLSMLLRDWPAPLRPTLRALLQALPEAAVTRSLGWPEPPTALQDAIRTSLRLRSRLANAWQRLVPPRGSRFFSERPTPSYGARFELSQLGPPPLLPMLNRARWQGRQRRIGLTGGIASGKSSVGRLLAESGLPLLDADHFAREALAPGSPGARAVLERYGERVRAETEGGRADGDSGGGDPIPADSRSSWTPPPTGGHPSCGETAIDRAALARIVFHDPDERRWLEELVHPQVRQRFASELERLADAPAVVLVIPLLFEAGLEGLCSEVWLVDCEPEQQLERLRVRDGLGIAEAEARLAAQWPLERKRPLADRLIDNRGRPESLAARLQAALQRQWGGPGGCSPSR